MGKYSIKDLERLSGIKAHTIRIWEKRYRLIQPQRTTTNIRSYSDEDLKRILNVSALNTRGIRISKIAGMDAAEINRKLMELNESVSDHGVQIDKLIIATVDLDESAFDSVLEHAERKGFEDCITGVIYPFLEKIGLLWQTGSINPAQEHFISNLIRQRIIVSTAALKLPSRVKRRAILFLPEGELHEIGLLYFNYILRSRGWKTYYLGQSVPHKDLLSVYGTHKPELLITSLISFPQPAHIETFIHRLSEDFRDATILVSGLRVRNTAFAIPKNVRIFYKSTELPTVLKSVL
jgi:DNA-binding transcriptional MerR regulator